MFSLSDRGDTSVAKECFHMGDKELVAVEGFDLCGTSYRVLFVAVKILKWA